MDSSRAYLGVLVESHLMLPLVFVDFQHVLKVLFCNRFIFILIWWTVTQKDVLQAESEDNDTNSTSSPYKLSLLM